MIDLKINGGKEAIVKLTALSNGGVGAGVQKALNTCALSVLALAQENSPVGEHNGGTFRQRWDISEKPPLDSNAVAGVGIVNNLPYAGVLEFGSPQGGKPWPNAGTRTVLQAGRVWSSQAPGGVITPELEAITKEAAAAVLEELSK